MAWWSFKLIHIFTKYVNVNIQCFGGKHVPIDHEIPNILSEKCPYLSLIDLIRYLIIVLEVHLLNSLVLDVGCLTGETGF